jgi:predicted transcriptional regulator
MAEDSNDTNEMLITFTADIVAAHVSNNTVAVSDLPTLISNIHGALAGLSRARLHLQWHLNLPFRSVLL